MTLSYSFPDHRYIYNFIRLLVQNCQFFFGKFGTKHLDLIKCILLTSKPNVILL